MYNYSMILLKVELYRGRTGSNVFIVFTHVVNFCQTQKEEVKPVEKYKT